MKRIGIIFLLSAFFYGMALGQVKGFNKEAFLIGTLDDYMGYMRTFMESAGNFDYQKVDIYHQSEMKLVLLIDSLFKEDFPDLRISNNNAPKGINLFSPVLSEKVDRYFTYEPSVMRTVHGDTIYMGALKKEELNTAEKRMSFLAGVYLRYGQMVDKGATRHLFNKEFGPDVNCIFIANSYSKAKTCKELLLAEGCEEVEYLITKDYIPVGHWLFFKPSKSVLEMIDKVSAFKKTLE